MRDVALTRGVNRVLEEHDLDVIIGPADSAMSSFAAAAGCPIATLPLGYLDYNGRAFGMVALAKPNQDAKLFQVMSAWDALFHPVRIPPMLLDGTASEA